MTVYERTTTVCDALAGVAFVDDFSPEGIGVAYDSMGGSYNMLARQGELGIQLFGWHVPGPDELPQRIDNPTSLTEVWATQRSLAAVGKGVGRRLYNTPAAVLGVPGKEGRAGLYMATIDPTRIFDARRPEDDVWHGKLRRITEHGGKLVTHKLGIRSTEDIVARQHTAYGDAGAIIWNQPPRAALRQAWRRNKSGVEAGNAGLPATFAIIRAAGQLQLVGALRSTAEN